MPNSLAFFCATQELRVRRVVARPYIVRPFKAITVNPRNVAVIPVEFQEEHGTYLGYRILHCRCELCRGYNAEMQRAKRAKQKAARQRSFFDA